MRDLGVIDALDAMERYARAFDEISQEQMPTTRRGASCAGCGWRRRRGAMVSGAPPR